MRLDGKVALITGGGSGIGAAIAQRFVTDGAKVCITGRRQAMLDKVLQCLPTGTGTTCAGDVTQAEDAGRMVRTTLEFGGALDVLVNNAAIDPGGSVTEIDPELWRKIMDINVNGPFMMMRAALPHMIKAGKGSIINVASLGGLRCLPGMPAYCTSKAALIMLTQQVALEYGPHNIRANAVCPGATRTEMLTNALTPLAKAMGTDADGVFSRITANVPLRRAAYPNEMGGVCSFLASDDSSYMTAAVLLLDGGASVVDPCGAALNNTGTQWGVGACDKNA